MKGKFIFESFQEYVENVLEKVEAGTMNEAEAIANLTAASSQIVGDLGLRGQSKGRAENFFDELSKYTGDLPAMAKRINEDIKKTFDRLTQKDKGVEISKNAVISRFSRTSVTGRYRYLFSNGVVAEGNPKMKNGDLDGSLRNNKENPIPLFHLLASVNAYNIMAFSRNVSNAANSNSFLITDRAARQYGGETPKLSYLWLEDADSRALRFSEKEAERQGKPEVGTISFSVPLYSVKQFAPKSGNNVDETSVTTVIKPGGTSVEVVDKPHNSSGTDFFAENDVVVSGEGLLALKALISQYNEIKTIKVNGSASSKPTSRAGGNEQLAKDRRSAGIKALEELKTAGAEQLKSAKIVEGTAIVQDGDPSESDASFQQVSFTISGMAKSSQINDKEPETITKIENIKADAVSFWQYTMSVGVEGGVENV